MFRQTRPVSVNPARMVRVLSTLVCAVLAPLMIGLPALQASSHLLPQHESVVTRFSLITTIAGNGDCERQRRRQPGRGSHPEYSRGPSHRHCRATCTLQMRFNHKIRQIAPDGVRLATFAGTGETGADGDGGQARDARLRTPLGVALDSDGTLYIADTYNHRIRKVTIDGTIRTIAGTGESGFAGDGGPGTAAELSYPTSVAVATDGTLYIADTRNHRVRKLAADGTITTVAGAGAVWVQRRRRAGRACPLE